MRVVTIGGRAESGGDGSVYAALGFELHIEPKNPRADCTISAARFTNVPACSCMPSNDTRCARDGCLDIGDVGLVGLVGALGASTLDLDAFVCEAEMGDDDGVVVIPPALLEEVVDDAYEQELQDAWVYEQVKAGNPVDGLFPPNAEWKAKFAEHRKTLPDTPTPEGDA